ncbi:hypothetical protein EXIGLDRAFT_770921 [Exidia glandulosa HHB12029]|uniref:Family A G protein-coupled receptor-like protein n=1 Tax=Exidia glandulosa HHB12029 TaxID=1314781 RepID=A0A165GDE6_EXIGL|nr:hypothetical protein EXIGLDRAFT_770921 [Exidia glandulosa HHB12029]
MPTDDIPSTDTILPLLTPLIVQEIITMITQSTLFGAYFALEIFAMYHLLRKGKGAQSVIAGAIFAMFATSTFLWGSNVAVLIQQINIVLGSRKDPIVFRLSTANASTQKLRYMDDIMFFVLYLIGDAVMAWRIVVLQRWNIRIIVILTMLWLGTLSAGTGLVGCLVHTNFPSPDDLPKTCTNLGNTAWLLSLVFNAICTCILARTTWVYRRTVGSMLNRKRTRVDRVLVTLVVSGVLYFLLGLPRLATFANPNLSPFPSKITFGVGLIELSLYQVVGIYPTVVIVVLLLDSSTQSTLSIMNRNAELSFAPHGQNGAVAGRAAAHPGRDAICSDNGRVASPSLFARDSAAFDHEQIAIDKDQGR